MPESIVNPETPAAPDNLQSVDDEISLLDLAIVLAKHKKLILGLPLAAAIVAAIISLLMPPIYTGTAKLLPPQQSQSTAAAVLSQLGALSGLAGAAVPGIKNPNDLYIAMLKSRTVADNLIQRFKLQELYESEYSVDARKSLEDLSSITSGRDGVITIEVEDKAPERAAALANAYVEELEKLTKVLAVSEASQRRLFFENQLKATKDGLAEAEIALQRTQEQTGLIKLDDQGKAIIEAVAMIRARIAATEVQLRVMRSFATDKNSEVMRSEQELGGLRAQLAKLERTNPVGQGDIFVPTGKVPEVGLEYVRKLREVKYHETLFELLAKQYELARIDEAKDAFLIQVLDKAVVPERKTRPKRALIVLLSVLVAGFLALLWSFVKESIERARQQPDSSDRFERLRRYLAWR
jgi:tyrosine-protein kinase Etk/Wzc